MNQGVNDLFVVGLNFFCDLHTHTQTQVFGIIQSTTDFKEQHLVMDGCSDLMMEVFGPEVGFHARSAIGTSTLPLDISIEVEAIIQIKPS